MHLFYQEFHSIRGITAFPHDVRLRLICPFEYSSNIITGQEVTQKSNSKSYNVEELTFIYALWNLCPL